MNPQLEQLLTQALDFKQNRLGITYLFFFNLLFFSYPSLNFGILQSITNKGTFLRNNIIDLLGDCVIDIEDVWTQLQGHFSKETRLKTISGQREFKAVYDRAYDEIVVTPDSTMMPRHITKIDFRKVWAKFVTIKEKPYRPGYYQRETRNASYIIALIKALTLEIEEPSGEQGKNLSNLKKIKGSLAHIVNSTWDELEETGDKFVREDLR